MDWIELAHGRGQVSATCECGNEHSDSIKCSEFLDQLQTAPFLKNDSAAGSKLRVCTRRLVIYRYVSTRDKGETPVRAMKERG